MKKNYLFAVGLFCAMAGVVACTENDPTSDYSTPAGDLIAFNCHSSWGEGNELIWTDKIQVGLFCEQSKSVNDALGVTALTVDQAEGAFYTKSKWGAGEYNFYLYAPYNKDNTTKKLAGTIPQTQSQTGVSTAHIDQNALIYAEVKSSKSATLVDVPFKQVLNYVDIAVSTTKQDGWDVNLVAIKAPAGVDLSGSYTFDLESGAFMSGANKSDSVAMIVNDVTLSSAPFHAYLLTAPFITTANMECRATVRVSKGNKTKELAGKLIIPSGVAAGSLASVSIDLDTFIATEIEDTSIDLCDPTDSGTPVTANCYIAGAPGQIYRFDATTMGNGYTTPATPDYTGAGSAGGITPTPLDPKSAKLLWQTTSNLISNVKLTNKQVYFTLNGTLNGSDLTEGNALIAVYSGENGTGDILWSWHIWVTADNLDANVQTYTVNDAFKLYSNYTSPQLMDRNLGATAAGLWSSSEKNGPQGLKYQWGRKDPFMGAGDIAGNTIIPVATFAANGDPIPAMAVGATDFTTDLKWSAVTGKKLTKENLTKYPMNLVYGATRWFEDAVDDFWGYPNLAEDSNNIGHKSIYDPCPPGYRVPHVYAVTGVMSQPIGGLFTAMDKHYVTNTATIAADFGTKVAYDWASNLAYWPGTGMINKDTGLLFRTGSYAYYWLSKKGTADNAFRIQFDTKNFRPMDSGAISYGQAVRCMKEK